jgi:DNA repair protein RadA/Sms
MVMFVLQVGQMERRLVEAAKLGFKTCVVPKSSNKALKGFKAANLITIPCADIKEVIEILFLRE